MKTNFIFWLLSAAALFTGCYSPKHLPDYRETGSYQYGSYIEVIQKEATRVRGELIAADSAGLLVLEQKSRSCTLIRYEKVRKFRIRYARNKNYWWSIATVAALPGINGLISIYTIPLHLAISIPVAVSGYKAHSYTHREVPIQKIRMYARFPNGLPAHIKPEMIQ